MPFFVRSMVILGLLALLAAMVMLWRSQEAADVTSHPARTIGKPIGTSTLSHGGPASPAKQGDSPDSLSQR